MADMVTDDHVQVRVAGMLRRVDSDGSGARRLAAEEFHDLMDRIAEHLDNEAEIADPSTWGQASTGDMEIRFVLEAPPVGGPELNQRIGSILKRLGDEVGLAWSTRPSTGPRHAASGMMLTQTRQICELAPA